MSGVVADLDLQVDPALDAVNQLDEALANVVANFSSGIEDALSLLSAGAAVAVPVEADTSAAEDALTSFTDAAESATPTVPVDADTSTAESDVEALVNSIESIPPGNLEVDANVDPAQAAIDELIAALSTLTDAITAMPPIEADASSLDDAAASADNLSSSLEQSGAGASNATGGMTSLSGATAGLGVAMAGAQGNTQGVTQGLLGITGASAGTAGAILGVGAAFGTFFALGEKSVAATERMTLVFGEFAHEAETIDIGGLTGDLADLAVQSGNSAAQMRQASATIGRTAQDMGLGQKAAANLANQFQAIALRATAMNPNLGEAGDVMNTLQRALAMGGRAATRMGLGFLQAGQIAAHAAIMFGKPKDQLSQFEKAAAGADIVIKRLGGSLGTDFAKGTQQSAVQFKALKAELIATIATLGRDLVPAVLAIAKAFMPLATIIASVLGVAFKALIPIINAVAAVLNSFLDGLKTIGDNIPTPVLIAFGVALGILAVALVLTSTSFWAAAVAAEAFLAALLTNPIFLAVAGIVALVAAIGQIGKETRSASIDVDKLAESSDRAIRKTADMIKIWQQTEFAGKAFLTTKEVLDQLGVALDKNLGAGRRFGQALVDAGVITKAQFNAALDDAKNKLDNEAKSADAAKSANDKLAESFSKLVGSTAQLPTLAQEANNFLQSWTNAFGQIPVSGEAFKNFIRDTATQTKTWFDQIVQLGSQGMAGLALVLAGVGPTAAPQFAAGFAQLTEVERQELNGMLLEAELQKAAIAAVMETYGPKLVAAFKKGGWKGLNDEMKAILAQVPQTITDSTPPAEAAAAQSATDQVNAFLVEFAKLGPKQQSQVIAQAEAAANTGKGQAPKLGAAGIAWGDRLGLDFGERAKTATAAGMGRAAVEATAEGMRHTGIMAQTGIALANGLASGLQQGTVAVAFAGGFLAGAAAQGVTNSALVMVAAAVAVTNAYAAGIRAGGPSATAAGLVLVQAAAAGTRNTGLFAEAGKAAANGYANGLHATGPAVSAAQQLVSTAAGATRNTGQFAAAGSAAAGGYANGIRGNIGAAVSAVASMVAAACAKARNAHCSPETIYETMFMLGNTIAGNYAAGIRAETDQVVAATQDMAHAAVHSIDDIAVNPTVGSLPRSTAQTISAVATGRPNVVTNENVTYIRVDGFEEALGMLPASVRANASFLDS